MNIVVRAFRKVIRVSRFYLRKREARNLNIAYVKPNYIYLDKFDNLSVIIDVGCGYDADFSLHMISKYGLRVFGVDPTLKHRESLHALKKRTQGRFEHLNLAVTSVDGKITFYESLDNVSGSIISDHTNVVTNRIRSYEVESVTLRGLLNRIESTTVDFPKLDLEGAEYELLGKATESDLRAFKQIFVEFHHYCIERYSVRDTKSIVQSVCKKGFRSFTLDDYSYLFYR